MAYKRANMSNKRAIITNYGAIMMIFRANNDEE